MKKALLQLFTIVLLFSSCKKEDPISDSPSTTTPTPTYNCDALVIPEPFDWQSTKTVTITIKTLDNQGSPLTGIPVNLLNKAFKNGGKTILSGCTDNTGNLTFNAVVSTYLTELVLSTPFVGLPNETTLAITGNSLAYTYGGTARKSKGKGGIAPKSTLSVTTQFLSTYNSSGVPDNILEYGKMDQSLLNDLNANLPEGKSIVVNQPAFVAAGNQTNITISQEADVWATFLHEGSTLNNTLAFYTYDLNTPPTSASEIDTITVLFPNTSMVGSGGGLTPGAKIKLGRFPANTGIGWLLIANGWDGTSVTTGNYQLYSNAGFNTSIANVQDRQHTILLHDVSRSNYIVGFEETKRNNSSDADFNDLLISVSASPVSAIESANIPTMSSTISDSDNDGVADMFDASPLDAKNAFISYFPSSSSWATLAFEDLWPAQGDYDFNDAVINYRVYQYSNFQNEVVKIIYHCYVAAAGASFHNGFGIELPIAPSQIQSVKGSKLTESYIVQNANGTEANQSKAVIIVFDDIHNMFSSLTGTNPSGMAGYNTSPGGLKAVSDTLDIEITLNTGVAADIFGTPPYNPFLIAKATRGREIHLPNQRMTDLGDASYFGTLSDNSNPSQNRYFKTKNNLPWAIHIPDRLNYPVEKTQIVNAHLKFAAWAQSGGTAYPDWYMLKPGYQNQSSIIINAK